MIDHNYWYVSQKGLSREVGRLSFQMGDRVLETNFYRRLKEEINLDFSIVADRKFTFPCDSEGKSP